MRWLTACLMLLPVAGCAARPVSVDAVPQEAVPSGVTVAEPWSPGRYRVSGTVLENVSAMGPKHGPQLCDSVRTSLPPQCGGLDIVNWSWDGVPHESAAGAKWGDYELVVTFDGTLLTVVSPPKVQVHPATSDSTAGQPPPSTPCAPPAGGWQPVERAKANDSTFQEAMRIAEASPEHAGTWIDQNQKAVTEQSANDPTLFILNVAYTGGLAAHEAELRKVWGGSLCVSQAKRTLADLARIQHETRKLPGVTGSSTDVHRNAVQLTVWASSPQRQRELDQRFGEGAVFQTPLLKPIE